MWCTDLIWSADLLVLIWCQIPIRTVQANWEENNTQQEELREIIQSGRKSRKPWTKNIRKSKSSIGESRIRRKWQTNSAIHGKITKYINKSRSELVREMEKSWNWAELIWSTGLLWSDLVSLCRAVPLAIRCLFGWGTTCLVLRVLTGMAPRFYGFAISYV